MARRGEGPAGSVKVGHEACTVLQSFFRNKNGRRGCPQRNGPSTSTNAIYAKLSFVQYKRAFPIA